MPQHTFTFDDESSEGDRPDPAPLRPADPNVHPNAIPRLSRLAVAVGRRLLEGPASNAELPTVGGGRWHGRIYDLRQAGCDIKIIERNHESGRMVYEMIHCPNNIRSILDSSTTPPDAAGSGVDV